MPAYLNKKNQAIHRAALITLLEWEPEDGTKAGAYCASSGELEGFALADGLIFRVMQ